MKKDLGFLWEAKRGIRWKGRVKAEKYVGCVLECEIKGASIWWRAWTVVYSWQWLNSKRARITFLSCYSSWLLCDYTGGDRVKVVPTVKGYLRYKVGCWKLKGYVCKQGKLTLDVASPLSSAFLAPELLFRTILECWLVLMRANNSIILLGDSIALNKIVI